MDEHQESSDQQSTLATAVAPSKKNQQRHKRQPKYHVFLWDDDHHSYEYVMHMMQVLFGHPLEKSFEIAAEVDKMGSAVCLTTTREHAELKRDQIHSFGKDNLIAGCKGSMSSSIEADIH